MPIIWEGDEDDKTAEEKQRSFTKDGKTLIVYPIDPHGFWKVRWDKKSKIELPKILTGAFTSIHEAEKAITAFFNTLGAPKPDPKADTLIG